MARARTGLAVVAICLAAGLLTTGCGRAAHRRVAAGTDPTPVAVIKGWSTALRRGDVRGAARYFALPSVFVNGGPGSGYDLPIRTFADAVAANSALPCGAAFVSAHRQGRLVNALFRLTDRAGPGGGCGDGVGSTARTAFLVKRGRIVEWIRAPDEAGDSRYAAPQQPEPPQQPAPSGSNSAV